MDWRRRLLTSSKARFGTRAPGRSAIRRYAERAPLLEFFEAKAIGRGDRVNRIATERNPQGWPIHLRELEDDGGCLGRIARLTAVVIALHHLYLSELLRVKGKVLLSQPQPNRDKAQAEFMQSLELSCRESARAWELRTAIHLAELLAGQQRLNDAKQLLQSAIEGFAEGSDTADIRAATRLLGTL